MQTSPLMSTPATPAPPAAAAAAASTAAKALSNKDFRAFLTPLHPSMGGGAATPAPTAVPAAAAKTPLRTVGSATPAAGGGAKDVKFASGDTATFKLSKKGIVSSDGSVTASTAEGNDEGDDGSASGSSSAPRGAKGERVLSSRERSFIQYQAKQAAKAVAKVKYRDRAKERQMDMNPDYAPLDSSVPPPETLSIEASKFLGGDMEHTHLVKGLDFALLAKVKEELERNEEAKLEALLEQKVAAGKPAAAVVKDEADGPASLAAKAVAASAAAPLAPAAAAIPAAPKPLTPAQQAAKNLTFHSSLASAVYLLTFDPPAAAHTTAPAFNDQFLPGRMSFDFQLPAHPERLPLTAAQQSAFVGPTVALTSKQDLDAVAQGYEDEHARGALPEALYGQVESFWRGHRAQAEERKLKRKRRGEGGEAVGDDEEISKAAPGLVSPSPAALAASSQFGVSATTGGQAQGAASSSSSSAAGSGAEHTVARPPPSADSDSDDDIFAGVGTDYRAAVDTEAAPNAAASSAAASDGGGMEYSVMRPPTNDDDDGDEYAYPTDLPPEDASAAPSSSAAVSAAAPKLFARDTAVPQLDPRASRMMDDDGEDSEDEDMFAGVSSTRAGDELLAGVDVAGTGAAGGSSTAAPLSAAERLRRKNALYADAEYEELFPEHHSSYSTMLDEDEDEPEEGSKKAKEKEAAAAAGGAGAGAGGKAGKTPMHRGGISGEELEERKREARFNAEYSQVASLLQARGVKLSDDASKRASATPRSSAGAATPARAGLPDDDERAIKRQRILKGFARK